MADEHRNGDDYYSPTQAAHVLRVTPTRVRQLLQAGELEGERDEAGHWSIPARAVVDRLDGLRRERFLEAAGYDPVSVREAQEQVEILQRELGRLEGRLESEKHVRRYLEADRAFLARRLERESLRRGEVERERDELLRQLESIGKPQSAKETMPEEADGEVPDRSNRGGPTDALRRSWWRSAFGRYRSG